MAISFFKVDKKNFLRYKFLHFTIKKIYDQPPTTFALSKFINEQIR